MHALHDPRQTTAKARRTFLTYTECVKSSRLTHQLGKRANLV
jgi:hypothetical protein